MLNALYIPSPPPPPPPHTCAHTDSSSQLVDKDSKDETTKNEVDDKGKPPGT